MAFRSRWRQSGSSFANDTTFWQSRTRAHCLLRSTVSTLPLQGRSQRLRTTTDLSKSASFCWRLESEVSPFLARLSEMS